MNIHNRFILPAVLTLLAGAFLPGQTRYPREWNVGPVTQAVADRVRAIVADGAALGRQPKRVIKVGDSITCNGSFVGQFKTPDYDPDVHYGWDWVRDLGTYDFLRDAADWFTEVTVPGESNIPDAHVGGVPFPVKCLDRVSLAAKVGESAAWAVTGSPNPLQQEIDAISPQFALIMFGANDVAGYGADADVLDGTLGNQVTIVDQCIAQGVVPILAATCPRADNATNLYRSCLLSHAVRALAAWRKIPFLNNFRGFMPLPDHGLGGDDLHPNAFSYNRGCALTPEALPCGHNMRNLLTLKAMNKAYRVGTQGVAYTDPETAALSGTGTAGDPFRVDEIAFSDMRSTSAPNLEYRYRLNLRRPLTLAAMVFDRSTTDVDLTLRDEFGTVLATHGNSVELALAAGAYTVTVSTAGANPANAGEYILVLADRNDTGYPVDFPFDLNADGRLDLLWRNRVTGDNAVWTMDGNAILRSDPLMPVGTAWDIAAAGDFNRDGKADLFWRNTTTGDNSLWTLNGTAVTGSLALAPVPVAWKLAAAADFDRDGRLDLLWRNTATGDNAVWYLDGVAVTGSEPLAPVPVAWEIAATGDFNRDGKTDLFWRNTGTGDNAIWYLDGVAVTADQPLPPVPAVWTLATAGDFDDDDRLDLLWRNTATGDNVIWYLDGVAVTSTALLMPVPTAWEVRD